jgi:DNA-binding NarL/FixJ family response regulator
VAGQFWSAQARVVIRVMLVDRSRIFAEALAARLDREADISVLAAHVPVEVGRRLLASGAVDVAVCDDQLAGDLLADAGSGSARGTVARRPPHVVVLAERGNEDRATALVQAGIAGWVTRDQSSNVLLAAIRGANDSETWIPPALLTRVLADLTSAHQQERAVVDRLTVLTER